MASIQQQKALQRSVPSLEKRPAPRELNKQPLLKKAKTNTNSSMGDQGELGKIQTNDINAKVALDKKLSALQDAPKESVKTVEMPDGRIRYYEKERLSKTPGATRGASYVTEHNPKTGQVRSWIECYDQQGNVNRVHPKMIDGQIVQSTHYPLTQKEIEILFKQAGESK